MHEKRPDRLPSTLVRANEVCVLSSFAIAQPLFDLIGADPAFLAAHGADATDVLVLVSALVVGLPMLALLAEGLAGLAGRALQRILHGFWIGGLMALALHPLLVRWIEVPEAVSAGAALAAGVAFAWLHPARPTVRALLLFLAPAPILFAGLFLTSDAVRPLFASSEGSMPGEASAPIVFLLLDELPLYTLLNEELEIDAGLFPSFARLAADSVWFRNATAVHPMTNNVVPSILTGRRIGIARKAKHKAEPSDLFRWLSSSHRLVVHESVTSLCPKECTPLVQPLPRAKRVERLFRDLLVVYGHWALPDSAAETLPPIESRWANFSGWLEPSQQREIVQQLIGSIRPDAPPTLYFAHVLLPHIPWFGLPGGATYPVSSLRGRSDRTSEDWPAKVAFQRHLLQVGYVDWILGTLLDRLEEMGIYDDALIVLLSDHGVAFQPGRHRRNIGRATLRDIVHIPLFVKPPFLTEGRIDDRNVESIDVLPTIADALGLESPEWFEGQSGLDDSIPPRPKKLVVDRGKWKVEPELPSSWPGVALKAQLFGSQPTWDDVYSLSTAPGLLGRSAGSILGDEHSGVSYQLVYPRAFDDVDVESGTLPIYVPGIVGATDPDMLPEEVALVIEGVVRGVGRTFEREGSTALFAMIIPPAALRPGANCVEVFAVDGERRLHPLTHAPEARIRPHAVGWPES